MEKLVRQDHNPNVNDMASTKKRQREDDEKKDQSWINSKKQKTETGEVAGEHLKVRNTVLSDIQKAQENHKLCDIIPFLLQLVQKILEKT